MYRTSHSFAATEQKFPSLFYTWLLVLCCAQCAQSSSLAPGLLHSWVWLTIGSSFLGAQLACFEPISLVFIAPQSFSGGGLVFKGKLVTVEGVWWVTMERVWWVTMIVHEGLLWISIWLVTVVCGIWVLRACPVLEGGLLRFLAVAGYYRKWWCIHKLIMIFIIELGI